MRSAVISKLNGPSSSHGVLTSVVYVDAEFTLLSGDGVCEIDCPAGAEKGSLKWTECVVVCAGAEVGGDRAGLVVFAPLSANDLHVARNESTSSLSRCETMASRTSCGLLLCQLVSSNFVHLIAWGFLRSQTYKSVMDWRGEEDMMRRCWSIVRRRSWLLKTQKKVQE